MPMQLIPIEIQVNPDTPDHVIAEELANEFEALARYLRHNKKIGTGVTGVKGDSNRVRIVWRDAKEATGEC